VFFRLANKRKISLVRKREAVIKIEIWLCKVNLKNNALTCAMRRYEIFPLIN